MKKSAMERNKRKKGLDFRFVFLFLVFGFILEDVEGIRRRIRRPPPPVLVKVGQEVISIKPKPQTVDISPLISRMDTDEGIAPSKNGNFPPGGLYVIRRKNPRNMNGFSRASSWSPYSRKPKWMQENRRSYDATSAYPPLSNSQKAKLSWMAMQKALQRQRAMKALSLSLPSSGPQSKAQYYRAILPILYHYKLQKQAADKYYTKYLKSLQLLALATSQSGGGISNSPELASLIQSFSNSPYGSLLSNTSFVSTNSIDDILVKSSTPRTKIVNGTEVVVEDQVAEASDRQDPHHHHDAHLHHHHHDELEEFTNYQRELEKQRRRLLEVFPPPQSEVPFGERTILMVRFPPVPHQKKTKELAKFSKTYDIDGGITFGGPRWLSFGTPFDPWDHPWNHPTESPKDKEPKKLILAEADKPSSYGVIITQNFVYRPSIRFTNSDPKTLAKNKADPLQGGPSIVTQLAKALAEGNRISNSYFLSKNLHEGKKWPNNAKKPPFVIVHLDTYTKKKNETGSVGISDEVEANYANGTIIYPTLNNPHILASTKFEFHNAKGIDKIFDKPLAILGHGYGWGKVPVYPKGIREIKNFLKLMYKTHQDAHKQGITKIEDLRKLGDKLERPAFPDSKPLLLDQIADRSTNWLHTSSVGIRSLSDHDDHFPYHDHPVVDITKDYDDHHHHPEVHQIHYHYL